MTAAEHRLRRRASCLTKGAALSSVWAGRGRLARWGRGARRRCPPKQGRVAPDANAKQKLAVGKRVQKLAELPCRIGPAQNGGTGVVRQPIESGAAPVLFERCKGIEQ